MAIKEFGKLIFECYGLLNFFSSWQTGGSDSATNATDATQTTNATSADEYAKWKPKHVCICTAISFKWLDAAATNVFSPAAASSVCHHWTYS